MKLKRVIVKNFAGCRFADVQATDAEVIVLTGKNEQGKTSFLRAIEFALNGIDKRKADRMTMPVFQGEVSASVTLETGEYAVSREIDNNGNETLTIKAVDGHLVTKPEALLKERFRSMSVNPLEFADGGPAKQVEMIEKIIAAKSGTELREDIQKLYSNYPPKLNGASILKKLDQLDNTSNGTVYMRRRDVRKECDLIKTIIDATLEPDPSVKDELDKKLEKAQSGHSVSIQALDQIDTILKNANLAKASIGPVADSIPAGAKNENILFWKNMPAQIEANLVQIAALQSQIQEKARSAQEYFNLVKDESREYDDQAKKFEQQAENRKSFDKLTKELEYLEISLKAIEAYRSEIMEGAKIPVDGLRVENDTVYLGEIPYAQASAARRTAVSIRLGMSASNPDSLKLMLIENGAFIGNEIFQEISDAAAANDYTLIIERPSDAEEVGYYFQGGKAEFRK